MSIRSRLRYAWLAISGQTPGPADDFWYDEPYAIPGSYGLWGSRGGSMRQVLRLDSVYACVSYLANTFGALSAKVYRRFPDGSKEEASRHPLYEVLHYQPNELNSAFDFRHREQVHFELAGNAYAEIVPDSRGPVGQLLPLDPQRMAPVCKANGQIVFEYRRPDGQMKIYLPEELHRVNNLSLDGLSGLSTISVWSDIIGGAMVLQDYANRFTANDSRPSVFLKYPQNVTLKPEAREDQRKQWESMQGGRNVGRVAIGDQGAELQVISVSNKDAQFIEARQFTVPQVARVFGLPPTKIGWLEKASYSNVEELNIATVIDAIFPRAVRREQAIRRDLLTPVDRAQGYYVEFDLNVLLRGNIEARYAAYTSGISAGWLVRNEPRRWENLNALPGLDKPLVPLNMGIVEEDGSVGETTGERRTSPPLDGEERDARAGHLALVAAHSLVQGECAALSRAMNREGSNGQGLSPWLEGYYAAMPERVANRLGVDMESARAYTEKHRTAALDAVRNRGLGALVKAWEKSAGPELAGMVVEKLP